MIGARTSIIAILLVAVATIVAARAALFLHESGTFGGTSAQVGYGLVTEQNPPLLPGAYPMTLTACQGTQCGAFQFTLNVTAGGPTLGPTTVSNSIFNATAGNATAPIGNLTTASSSGTAIPNYSLVTSCGTNCADSAKFGITGNVLSVGGTDVVCGVSSCTYNITVRDTDSEQNATNSPFDQHLVLTGNGATAGPVLGPTTVSNSIFLAAVGSANTTIGTLSTQTSSGMAIPSYSLLTTCGANCTDSSKFAITGTTLKVGASDIVCGVPSCTYNITVRDTDSESGVTNSPFDQHLTLTGTTNQTTTAQWVVPTTIACVAATPFNGVGSISGTTLTVTGNNFTNEPGILIPGLVITGSGVAANTTIINQLTTTDQWGEPGRNGTYTVSVSQNVASEGLGGGEQQRCTMPALGSYAGDSLLVIPVYCGGASGCTAPSTNVPIIRFRVRNGAAVCSAITPVAGIGVTPHNVVAYLCPDLTDRANIIDITWASAVGYPSYRVFEIYGCTSPCTVDSAAASTSAITGSISTPSATTANNDLIFSFANVQGTSTTFTPGACCVSVPTGPGNPSGGSQLGEYQVGATQQVYTNTFTGSGGFPAQVIVALKQNASPPSASPAAIYPYSFTANSTDTSGKVVGHPTVRAAGNFYYRGTLSLSQNPGGLLSLTQTGASAVVTLARTLTSADVGSYTGQLSATANGITITQPLLFNVLAPLPTLPTSTNCDAAHPPPAAVRAGFTKLSYCLDGAAASKATTSNWLDCQGTNVAGFEWYIGIGDGTFANLGGPTICSSITQIPDPISGRTVLDFHYDSTAYPNLLNSPSFYNGHFPGQFALDTVQQDGNKPIAGEQFPPVAYYEIGYRTVLVTGSGALGNWPAPDFWSWGLRTTAEANLRRWGPNEYDFFEMYGPYNTNSCGTAVHDWVNGGGDGGTQLPGDCRNATINVPGWTGVTGWHKYGSLKTSDGSSVIRFTTYIDDILNSPNTASNFSGPNPFDQPLALNQVAQGLDESFHLTDQNFMVFWWGGTFGLNTPACQANPTCVSKGGQSNTDQFIDHIAAWVDPNGGFGTGINEP